MSVIYNLGTPILEKKFRKLTLKNCENNFVDFPAWKSSKIQINTSVTIIHVTRKRNQKTTIKLIYMKKDYVNL